MGYELGSSHQRTKIEKEQTEYQKRKDGYVVKYCDIQEVGQTEEDVAKMPSGRMRGSAKWNIRR